MAGKGPLPKHPSQRARRNKGPEMHVIESAPVPQPKLPTKMPNGEPWPKATRDWWKMWGSDPLAAEFRATDWSELMDTAVLHGLYWTGHSKYAGELRLRAARFGATAEDRARLRIQYAAADEAEDKRTARRSSTAAASESKVKQQYQGLRAVD